MCTCTECQKLSSGIASFGIVVQRDDFHIVSGECKQWERGSETGKRNIAHFCPDCGNRIFHEDPDAPETIRLKLSTLSDHGTLEPEAYVWLRSAPAWMTIPAGALAYDMQPPLEELTKAIEDRRDAR